MIVWSSQFVHLVRCNRFQTHAIPFGCGWHTLERTHLNNISKLRYIAWSGISIVASSHVFIIRNEPFKHCADEVWIEFHTSLAGTVSTEEYIYLKMYIHILLFLYKCGNMWLGCSMCYPPSPHLELVLQLSDETIIVCLFICHGKHSNSLYMQTCHNARSRCFCIFTHSIYQWHSAVIK